MKLIHLSDLHLGKRVNEFNMLEDQTYILDQICKIITSEQPDAVLIAGDVYDKAVPSAEAVQLFDRFLCKLAELRIQVFVISGNHDSAERIAFGGRIMDISGIHMSPVYDGSVEPIELQDPYGPVRFYMLPFIKPAHVRRCFPDDNIDSYTDAISSAVMHMNIDQSVRNILITHQFVTGARRTESEELSVGGTDNVDASVFEPFDYVALGHLHAPQQVERETIRYCGTTLKYSFSEAGDHKSVTVIELAAKGTVNLTTIPLTPIRDLREIRGSYMDITSRTSYEGTNREDYIHITLTDEDDIPDAIGKLRVIYPNIMKLDYDNARTRASTQLIVEKEIRKQRPLELFEKFYGMQNNQPMSTHQKDFARTLMEEIWEGEV